MNLKAKERLYTPTQIIKLNNIYFIVDCYHHRIIYSDNLENSISEWKTIDYEFSGGHSITSNGEIYVTESTGKNELIVFDSNLEFKQKFLNVGERPHKTIYDKDTDAFYVISSGTQEIYSFKMNTDKKVYINYTKKLVFLNNSYTRGIKIIDGYMYFLSSTGYITVADYKNNYTVINSYSLPDELFSLNDIEKIGSYYYITSTQNKNWEVIPKIIRVKDLNNANNYEDLYDLFGFKATPYFISSFDDKYFVTEIGTQYNGVKSFEIKDDNIINIKNIYYFDEVIQNSIERRDTYPL